MIKFEKVSYEQFEKDSIELGYVPTREIYDAIKLPTRSTKGSAGYDFVTPYKIDLQLGYSIIGFVAPRTVSIPTGIKVSMPTNAVLMCYPRSGIGFKTGIRLANTVGVIDSDYYNNSNNEGHIILKLTSGFGELHIKEGDRVMQGVFVNYLTTDDDSANADRVGGFGSTGSN